MFYTFFFLATDSFFSIAIDCTFKAWIEADGFIAESYGGCRVLIEVDDWTIELGIAAALLLIIGAPPRPPREPAEAPFIILYPDI